MLGYTLVVLVFATVEYASSADVGEVCTSNSTCTVSNSWCPPSFPGCSSQKCTCLPGFDHQNTPSACKLRRYYRDTCSSTDSCQAGSACSSGNAPMCDCTSYNDNLHMCFTAAQKAISEDCTTVADCYDAVAGSTKCAVPTGSTGSQKKCLCNDGYIEEARRCRKPHYDETCTSAVGCVSRVPEAVTDDSSFATETCNSAFKCKCPTSNSAVKILRVDGIKTVFCMASGSGSVAIGGTCTASNQCNGGFCYKCPGQTNKICIADTYPTQNSAGPGVTLFRELYWIGWVVLFSRMF